MGGVPALLYRCPSYSVTDAKTWQQFSVAVPGIQNSETLICLQLHMGILLTITTGRNKWDILMVSNWCGRLECAICCCAILIVMSAVNLAFSLFHLGVLLSDRARCIVMRVNYSTANEIVHSKCQTRHFQAVPSLSSKLKGIIQDFVDVILTHMEV